VRKQGNDVKLDEGRNRIITKSGHSGGLRTRGYGKFSIYWFGLRTKNTLERVAKWQA